MTAAAVGLLAAGCGGDDESPVEILSPKNNANVSTKDLVARVRAEGSDFNAILEGRDVTNRFGEPEDGVRTATFTRGRDFKPGRDALSIQVEGSDGPSATVVFDALKRDDSALKLEAAAGGPGSSQRVERPRSQFASTAARSLRTQAPRGAGAKCTPLDPRCKAPASARARSGKEVIEQRTYVNGRLVTDDPTDSPDSTDFVHHLSPNDGLHPGVNRIVTEVEFSDRTFARKSSTVTLPQGSPLADAGKDLESSVGRGVELDGSKTQAPTGGGKVSYRWSVVSAPRGSNAKLAATTPQATFTPDRPGTYRLRLTATSADGAKSVDETELKTGVTDDPMGVRIRTINGAGAIEVGIPRSGEYSAIYGKKGSWIHMVALDALTLERRTYEDKDDKQVPVDFAYGPADVKTLSDDLKNKVKDDDIVILSGQGNDVESGFLADDVKAAVEMIGATVSQRGNTPNGAGAFAKGDWSIIGNKGQPVGSADQNFLIRAGVPGGGTGQPGSLNGYLQKVSSLGYQFVGSDFVSLDTKANDPRRGQPAPSQNVMTVNGKEYPSKDVGGGKAMGFHLLLLDPDGAVPEVTANETYTVRKPDGTLDDGVQKLAERLMPLAKDTDTDDNRRQPLTVLLQSFGNADSGQPGPDGKSNPNGLRPVANQFPWVVDTFPGKKQIANAAWTPTEYKKSKGGTLVDVIFPRWCGGTKATQSIQEKGSGGWGPHKCDTYPNHAQQPDLGGPDYLAGTVTEAIGLMAGLPSRNEVANLGRTSVDRDDKGEVVHRGSAKEELVLVGSEDPYSDDQSIVEVGGNVRDASESINVGGHGHRMITTLRRSAQSQWAPSGGSTTSNRGLDTGDFWEVAFKKPTPWQQPPTKSQNLAEAHAYVVQNLFKQLYNAGVRDVRDVYVTNNSDDWGANGKELDRLSPQSGKDSQWVSDFNALKDQLGAEFVQLAQVKNMIDSQYKPLVATEQGAVGFHMNVIGNAVRQQALKDIKNLEADAAQVNQKAPWGAALYLIADLFELAPEGGEFIGGPIAMFASAYDLFSELNENEKKEDRLKTCSPTVPPPCSPPDYPDRIVDKASNIGQTLFDSYAALNGGFEHLHQIYVADAGKLKQAAENFEGQWNLSDGTDRKKGLQLSLGLGAKSAFWKGLMPVAYDQFFVSPVETTTGNKAGHDPTTVGPLQYNCDDGPKPFRKGPPWGLHWVRFAPSTSNVQTQAENGQNQSVGRALKSKSDPLTTVANGTNDYLGTRVDASYPDTSHAGSDPPPDTTQYTWTDKDNKTHSETKWDALFAPVQANDSLDNPRRLGMSKDEFYGLDTWTRGKLQCGASQDINYIEPKSNRTTSDNP